MQSVYDFWFGSNANTYSENYKMNTKLWFRASSETDAEIKTKFQDLLESTARQPQIDTPFTALCSIILLDQFTRHVYRGTAAAFKYDAIAAKIACDMVDKKWTNELSHIECLFVYFALMHQESIPSVTKSVVGFHELALCTASRHSKIIQTFEKSAIRHLEIIEKFGRYPHRNAALSRQSTPEEVEFMAKYGDSLFMKSQQPKIATPDIKLPAARKLKMLCLHGWRQNGQIFKLRLKKMIRELGDVVDFHFVTSPVEYKPEGDALDATLSAYESIPDYNKQRVWWISSEGNQYYQYSDVTLAALRVYWEKNGPFDGIMGFAQGATMAAIMASRGFDAQFLVLISGYVPRADEYHDMNVAASIKTPSIHVYGKNDILVVAERSEKLHQLFVNGTALVHDGGHFVPKYWPYEQIKKFVMQFQPRTTIIKTENETDWAKLTESVDADNIATIAKRFAAQLKRDFAVGYHIQKTRPDDKFRFDAPEITVNEKCPSSCVDAVVGKRNNINKKYGFAKLVAAELFPHVDSEWREAYFYRAIRLLREMRQRLAPEYNEKIVNQYTESRSSEARIRALEKEPPSHHITTPKAEPVTPCPLSELQPLIKFLTGNNPVISQTKFPRGTITTDGRLDLCKQVVGPAGISPVLNAMKNSAYVKRLLLGNNIVGDGGAFEIASEMTTSQLECWYIAGNDFTAKGIAAIAESLKTNLYCTSLWLKRNPIGPDGMASIADMLIHNSVLQVLDLVNCGLLDAGLEILLSGLTGARRNRTLRVLWLDTNAITYKSANLLANYIARECELTDLSLSCNRIADTGMEIIAPAIAQNTTLTRISFASNRIGPAGAKYFCQAIQNHPKINFINLGYIKSTDAVHELGNFIGDDGASYVAELLKHNSQIRHIDLLHNSISQAGVNHIIAALKNNTTLVKLQLTQFKIVHNEPGKEYIKEKLAINYALLNDDNRIIVDKMITPWYIQDIHSVYRTKF